MDRLGAIQFAIQDRLDEASARFLVPASGDNPIIIPPWIWGEARREAYVRNAEGRRRAKADADVRDLNRKMAAFPSVDVKVSRSPMSIDPEALLETSHVKRLRARVNSKGEFSLAADRIGRDRERLTDSIMIGQDGWIETGDSVKKAATPGFFSAYEMREINLYDGHYRAHREETYFRHGIVLSHAAFRVLEIELAFNLEPKLSSYAYALFSVVSAIPPFLPGRKVAGGESVNKLVSRELIPEFGIFLLEDPHDASSATVECLTFSETRGKASDVVPEHERGGLA